LNQNNLQTALRLYEDVLYIRQNRNYYNNREDRYYQLARSYNNLGKVYYMMHNYTASIKNYHSALQNYLELQKIKRMRSNFEEYSLDNMEIARCYRHIGVAQRERGDTEEAIKFLLSAEKIMRPVKNHYPNNKAVLEELATVLFDLSVALHNQSGEAYCEQAKVCVQEAANLFSQAQTSSSDDRIVAVKSALEVYGRNNNIYY
jgi:tetratricopeptide (TPR) repeat protein